MADDAPKHEVAVNGRVAFDVKGSIGHGVSRLPTAVKTNGGGDIQLVWWEVDMQEGRGGTRKDVQDNLLDRKVLAIY